LFLLRIILVGYRSLTDSDKVVLDYDGPYRRG
jgi:hypothetical protein